MIHLPVQSGSDTVLAAMRRWYTAEDFEQLTQRIVAAVPDATFATDIIVGFPGETEDDFQKTVDLVTRVGFVKAFIRCYSPRPALMPQRIFPTRFRGRKKSAAGTSLIR